MAATAKEREQKELAECTFKPQRVTTGGKKQKKKEEKRDFNKIYEDLI